MIVEHPTLRERPARPSWLSIHDFAEAMGVSTKSVRNWIGSGYVKAERVGPRLIRIPASELGRVGTPVGAVSP